MTDRALVQSGAEVRAFLREIETPGTGRSQVRMVIRPASVRLSLFDGTWSDSYMLHPGNASWRERDVRYAVNDRLWVREPASRANHVWVYGADKTEVRWPGRRDLAGFKRDTLSGPFLPRSCSRLTLLVHEVRIQRLQDISPNDALAEGVRPQSFDAPRLGGGVRGWAYEGQGGFGEPTAVLAFASQWNDRNGLDAWTANPWVCALTVRPILANIDTTTTEHVLSPQQPGRAP